MDLALVFGFAPPKTSHVAMDIFNEFFREPKTTNIIARDRLKVRLDKHFLPGLREPSLLQDLILSQIDFHKKSKSSFFLIPVKVGRPGYFWWQVVIVTPRWLAIISWVSSGTSHPKQTSVLEKFMACYEASKYNWRLLSTALQSSIHARKKIRLSSTKSRWETQNSPLSNLTLLISSLSSPAQRILDIPSKQKKE